MPIFETRAAAWSQKVQTPSWVDPPSKQIQESSFGELVIGVLITGDERQLRQPVSTTSLRDVSLPIPVRSGRESTPCQPAQSG